MAALMTAVVIGILCLTGLIAYFIRSGASTARNERDVALQEGILLEDQLAAAKRGLLEIASGQTGNPPATALSTLDQVERIDAVGRKKEIDR
jgi:hypothetical protein